MGSVFVADYWPVRFTDRCIVDTAKLVGPNKLGMMPEVSSGHHFDVKVGLPDVIAQAIKEVTDLQLATNDTKKVVFGYAIPGTVTSVDVTTLDESLRIPECLAEIGNRPVLVLASIFEMKETYRSERALGGSVSVKLLKSDSIKLELGSDGSFVLQDAEPYPRVWAFFARQYNVPGLDPSAPFRERTALAADFLGNEGEDQLEVTVPDLSEGMLRSLLPN